MRVEKITHNGKVRVMMVTGLDAYPKGLVMLPATFEQLREPLEGKYGPLEEVEREVTPEELAMVAAVSESIRDLVSERGNGDERD